MNDPRAELIELIDGARALVEWFEETGSDGVPSELSASEALALLDRATRPAARAPKGNEPISGGTFQGIRTSAPTQARPAAPVATAAPVAAAPAQAHQAPPPIAPSPATLAPLGEAERRQRLATLNDGEVRGCTKCGLSATRTQTVFARGNPMAELVFVGEGPGADEDRLGEPFVGKAGQLLDKMITAMGYAPADVYICNVVKCRPPENRKPEPAEMAACLPYLHEQLAVIRPRAIVALGATAVQGLLGAAEGITRMRGTWKIYRGSIPIMPTFHPAYLLRDPTKKADVWSDLQQVMKQLGKTLPKRG
jgi:uracil-DNA glycosylase family 4